MSPGGSGLIDYGFSQTYYRIEITPETGAPNGWRHNESAGLDPASMPHDIFLKHNPG